VTLHPPDTRDDPGSGGFVVVQPICSERRQLEERTSDVQDSADPIVHPQLAAIEQQAERAFRPVLAGTLLALTQVGRESEVVIMVAAELVAGRDYVT
jgi:hypothetical protein